MTRTHSKQRKKKRFFLLMEVMIALALIAISIVPLMRMPIVHFQREVEHLAQFEKHLIADWAFSEVKELLLKNSIPWEKLPRKNDPPLLYPLSKVDLEIPGIRTQTLARAAQLKCTGEKESENGNRYHLFEITIFLNEEKITPFYRIMIEKNQTPLA
jgi:hypothetical protein